MPILVLWLYFLHSSLRFFWSVVLVIAGYWHVLCIPYHLIICYKFVNFISHNMSLRITIGSARLLSVCIFCSKKKIDAWNWIPFLHSIQTNPLNWQPKKKLDPKTNGFTLIANKKYILCSMCESKWRPFQSRP